MKVTILSASLVYFLATTSAVSAYHPQPPNVRVGIVQARDANYNVRRHVRRSEHALPFEKRAPVPQIDLNPSGTENAGNDPPSTQSTSSTSSQDTGGNTSSSTPPAQPPPQTTTSSSSTPSTEQPNTTTSTTSDAAQTSSTITTTVNSSVTTTGSQGTTIRNTANTQAGTTRTASQGTYTVRGSQTSSSATATSTSATTPFMKNKGAVAATAVVVSLVAVGALIFVGFWLKKKNEREKMGDDTWDEASMKEFPPVSHHGAGAGGASGVAIPPPLMTSAGGLGRSNTVLPSQSAGASPLARTKSHSARSHEDDGYGGHSDEPDEILAMPPVKNYERPRDSAFDIVPPPPPVAVGGASGSNSAYSPTAYSPGGYNNYGYGNAYASTSASAGGLEPPRRKGDHTSYGSGVGVDPFAGTGFVDATREASYGQAGRGAGSSSSAAYGGHYGGSDEDAYDGNAVAGPSRSNYQTQPNQWGQAYNPYQGYGQASGSGSKGGYGGYGYAS